MGCTDERSVSSKSKQKRGRSHPNTDNPKGDKIIEKKNSLNEEDIKEFSKSPKKEQNIKSIQFNNNNINNNKSEDLKESKEKKDNDNDDDNDNEEDENEEEEVNNDIEDEDKSGTDELEDDEMDPDVPEMNREIYREISPYLQARVNPNFNFPEVKDNTYSGKGLRRMKGYISNVPKEELEKRRISFWGTRIEGDPQVWNFLRELCELPEGEEENLKAMLEANEIIPLKKCINVTYNKSGEIYEIPNYCINEPVSYDLPEMHMKKPEKQNINFHARKGAKQIKIKAFNTTLVDKVKSHISTKLQIDPKSIRLFFGGKEMKDGNELWVYKIVEDCVILIMCPG